MSFRFVLGLAIAMLFGEPTFAQKPAEYDLGDRIEGLLVGSLLGDAAGGPVEFKSNDELKEWLPDLRAWSAERFRRELRSGELAERFELLGYENIRPGIADYGPWETNAAAGTVTDDSRHKMVLMNCLRELAEKDEGATSVDSLAQSYVNYAATHAKRNREDYRKLTDQSFKEYVAVARWLLGERDLAIANPPQRLWVGIATCSGQMTLPPIACVFPGEPIKAYRAGYALGFVDVGQGKDINSALVAGLSAGIGCRESSIDKRWEAVFSAMRVDPYRYADVPFAKRPATEWLDFAMNASKRANGSPKELFRILEEEGRPKYYWDAHFTFAVAIACLEFCERRPKEALVTSLAFGHDTDSAAQVIGALTGAVLGTQAFAQSDRTQVRKRLKADYGEDLNEWVEVLLKLSDRKRYPNPVRFVED